VPRSAARSLPVQLFVPAAESVPFLRGVASARTIGMCVGASRLAIGAAFLAAPVTSVRILGLDSATAVRVAWLARMTAIRDGVVGAGTVVSSAREDGASGWLLAGAVSDAVDAAVLISALREGRVAGWRARAIAAGAVAAAVVAAATAVDVRRRD
jgi:hypothetical protein